MVRASSADALQPTDSDHGYAVPVVAQTISERLDATKTVWRKIITATGGKTGRLLTFMGADTALREKSLEAATNTIVLTHETLANFTSSDFTFGEGPPNAEVA